jgi:hypothetical protein
MKAKDTGPWFNRQNAAAPQITIKPTTQSRLNIAILSDLRRTFLNRLVSSGTHMIP